MKKSAINLTLSLCLSFITNICFGQADITGVVTGHAGASNTGYYVGWDANTTFPLNIRQIAVQPINFHTANIQRMTILGSTNPGFVGIGSFTPNHKLDVDSGDININFPTNGYRIVSTALGSQYVLRNNNIPTNIYVGVGAGNNNATLYNTFVGTNTGTNTGTTTNG